MIYFFQIGTKPPTAFDVNLEGIVTEDCINDYHHQKMAEYHAKVLSEFSTEKVRFYPKGKENDAVVVDAYSEEFNSKGGSNE